MNVNSEDKNVLKKKVFAYAFRLFLLYFINANSTLNFTCSYLKRISSKNKRYMNIELSLMHYSGQPGSVFVATDVKFYLYLAPSYNIFCWWC